MPRPISRHRRKAGSGPPAAALIAWIGADAHPYRAAGSPGDCVREPGLLVTARSRSTGNVAAGVALVCGTVLAVTATTTQEIVGPLDATTSPVIPQARPGQAGLNQTGPPAPVNQVDPKPVVAPVPAATRPAVIRQAPMSIPVPPATERVAEEAAAPPAAAPAPPAAASPASRSDAARVRTQPDAPAQPRIRSESDVTRRSPSTRTSQSSQRSTSDRGSRSGGLEPTLNRATGSLGSTLGLR